jgi:hypothetical protein
VPQDRAPLSWTNERADTLFVCEREREAAASLRDPRERSEQLDTVRAEPKRGARERSHQKEGAIRRGESGSPLELLGSRALKSWRAGGYAARTDFPRSLAIAWRSI